MIITFPIFVPLVQQIHVDPTISVSSWC